MKFKHFEIRILDSAEGYNGNWRICESQSTEHLTHAETCIPLGKRLTKKKLEDFVLDCVAQADAYLLKGEAYETWKGVKIGKPLVEVFNPDWKAKVSDE